MQLLDKLQHHASHRPDAVALAHVERDGQTAETFTYFEYHRAVARVAEAIGRATPAGAVVLIQMPNALTYPVAFLGVLAAGRTLFPLHPALTPYEVGVAAKIAGAGWIIGGAGATPGVETITPKQVASWISTKPEPPQKSPGFNTAKATMLLQSSGTTGLPKIVERSAASINAVAQNVAHAVGLSPGDNVLAAIPLCHSYGIENAVVGPLWAGSTVHVCDGFDPETIAALWSHHKNVVFPAVPVMIDLLGSRDLLPVPDGNLHTVYAAGATLPAAVADAFFQRYGVRVGQLYGATEIGSVTFGDARQGALAEGCVGTPMGGVRVCIRDLEHPEGEPSPAPGQEGQVAVHAPSMLDRYLGGNAMQLIDGHFLTGDLGVLDAQGALSITGRVKTLIEIGGMKVNPMEVERVLADHPGVAECVVVPVPVTQTLSRVTAFIVPHHPDAPPSTSDLRAYAKARLAAYKVPRAYNVVSSLPRTSLGKVHRRKLMGTPA